MERTYKYRLLPNGKQEVTLLSALDACRRLYNACLEQRQIAWRSHRRSLSSAEQSRELPAIMAASPAFKAVQHHVLQRAVRRVDLAFGAFFRRVAAQKGGRKHVKVGYPRYKSRHRYRSLDFDVTAFRLDGERVRLSKVGMVKLVLHRPIPKEATVKRALVKRDTVGDWWVSFSAELPEPAPKRLKKVLGVDVGLTQLIATSDGEVVPPPKPLATALERLRRKQRTLARRARGSRRREKQRIVVAKEHRRIGRIRSDWLHKASRRLADEADVIVFEDLEVPNMVKNRHLSRAIHDAAWGELVRMTTYKAEGAGGRVVRVEPRGSSQECSNCGGTVQKGLAERVHRCPCGLELDRDVNAARVLLKRGLRELHGPEPLLGALARAAPTGGTPGRYARGDQASTAAQAAASRVVEAGRSPPF